MDSVEGKLNQKLQVVNNARTDLVSQDPLEHREILNRVHRG